jgi:hypothetical protein
MRFRIFSISGSAQARLTPSYVVGPARRAYPVNIALIANPLQVLASRNERRNDA